MENKIKLSDKQKEVIKLMREGCRFWIGGGFSPIARASQSCIKISISTLFAMQDKKLIEPDNTDLRFTNFALTELGKTIEL